MVAARGDVGRHAIIARRHTVSAMPTQELCLLCLDIPIEVGDQWPKIVIVVNDEECLTMDPTPQYCLRKVETQASRAWPSTISLSYTLHICAGQTHRQNSEL